MPDSDTAIKNFDGRVTTESVRSNPLARSQLLSYIFSSVSIVFSGLVLTVWVRGAHPSWPQAGPVASAIMYAPAFAIAGFVLAFARSHTRTGRQQLFGAMLLSFIAVALAALSWVFFASTIHP